MFDRVQQEMNSRVQLVRRADERCVTLFVGHCFARRIGDAPMRHRGMSEKVRAYFADAIAQADHVVETLLGEFAQVLGVNGYPATAFFDEEGELLVVLPGYMEPAQFKQVLTYFGDNIYKDKSWEDYQKIK